MRMMLDVAEMMAEEPIIWLNLEPTAGYELEEEYTYYPEYINAAIGQLNENAAIAEKLGFTIDPDVWHKRVYVGNEEDDDKDLEYEVIEMRKCAFKIPNNIKKIIRNDGNLVAIGRAKQAVQQLEKLNIGFEL